MIKGVIKDMCKSNLSFNHVYELIIKKSDKSEEFLDELGFDRIKKDIISINAKMNGREFKILLGDKVYYLSKYLINRTDYLLSGNIDLYLVENIVVLWSRKKEGELSVFYRLRSNKSIERSESIEESDFGSKITDGELFLSRYDLDEYRVKFAKNIFNKHKDLFSFATLNDSKLLSF